MILVDANILLYAVNAAAEPHGRARSWLDARLSSVEPVGFAWPVVLALAELVRQTQSRGNLIQDAHLAALAIELGATLCSSDADFSRFPELKWNNPLRAEASDT
jgi:uncharacterized protein